MFGRFIIALAGIISITHAYYNNYVFQSQGPWGQYQDENGNINTASHSSFSSGGGSNVVVNRRMGPNQEVSEFISVTNPNVKIDGDYCKISHASCTNELLTLNFQSTVPLLYALKSHLNASSQAKLKSTISIR